MEGEVKFELLHVRDESRQHFALLHSERQETPEG